MKFNDLAQQPERGTEQREQKTEKWRTKERKMEAWKERHVKF
jgi:hypothetical protein